MGNDNINPNLQHVFSFFIHLLHFELYFRADADGSRKYYNVERPSLKNEIAKREAEIQRSRTLLNLEKAVLEQRGHLLQAQEDLNDVRKSLKDIRERLVELSE